MILLPAYLYSLQLFAIFTSFTVKNTLLLHSLGSVCLLEPHHLSSNCFRRFLSLYNILIGFLPAACQNVLEGLQIARNSKSFWLYFFFPSVNFVRSLHSWSKLKIALHFLHLKRERELNKWNHALCCFWSSYGDPVIRALCHLTTRNIL